MASHFIRLVPAALLLTHLVSPAVAQDTQLIQQEIKALKQSYENRISKLEALLKNIQKQQNSQSSMKPTRTLGNKSIYGNRFNPSIGIVLNGKVSSYSLGTSEIAGFGVGEEGERGREGLAIDESELNFSANVDDKFYGSLTAAIVREDGEDKVELEEAYVQSLAGAGLPNGWQIKAGRAFWTLGYMNEHHAHADDFADRPLPYRIYLNKAFNDDGAEISYVLPTKLFSEIGGGVFRGGDFPAGGSTTGFDARSVFGRVGGDIGNNQSWRIGAYLLDSDVTDRKSNEDGITFIGKSRLYAADFRYTLAPTGNARNSEIILQGEYFQRDEEGTYNVGSGAVAFDDVSDGWYAQAVYKFSPNWRVGSRFSAMNPAGVAAGLAGSTLDASGHDPNTISVMADWTNSEFSRIRLQYNREELSSGKTDNQYILQYTMSIGAHGAHAY